VTRRLAPAAGQVPAAGQAARTACARVLVRGGIDEKTGEVLSATVVEERVGWCAALVQGIARRLAADHWHPTDLVMLASGKDRAGKPLPSQAWMAMRRLGWAAVPPDGVTANDRIIRMAQELAGRTLRPACWRDALTRAVEPGCLIQIQRRGSQRQRFRSLKWQVRGKNPGDGRHNRSRPRRPRPSVDSRVAEPGSTDA
jgi:hypothetical protein